MRFIESILYKEGTYHHIPLHQKRFCDAFRQCKRQLTAPSLYDILPDLKLEGTYKARIVYDLGAEEVSYDVDFAEYVPRSVQTLELVDSPPFDYSMKYENRSSIDQLVQKATADDIIITINNRLTDGSYFNLVFWDGAGWYTPDTFLLNGVRRQHLLDMERIQEATITRSDIGDFEKVSLINAMLDLGALEVPTVQVSY